jgi:hypothetical protein
MPMRKNEGPGPQVTVRFPDGRLCFVMSAGDTVGDLAGRLARHTEEGRAKPLSIDLTFPRTAKPVLH